MLDDDLFDESDEDTDVAFRDMITLALAGFVAIVLLLLPHLNPPKASAATADVQAPGNVMVELRWPDQLDADVDLWVQAPGDRPVGYSNKGGRIFNLLRDDLGQFGDATGLNYEVAYSRGLPPGEYAVNVHLYRNPARQYPIPVTAVVSLKREAHHPARQILTSRVLLRREGEELTVFRFALADRGKFERDSVHSIYRPLRSGGKR